MSKLILVSFADKRYKKSLEILKNATRNYPFDERYFHTEVDIFDKKFWYEAKPWLYRRGFGYWVWKSNIIKYYLDRIDEGDMLFWSDAGITWNDHPQAISRFEDYINNLGESINVLSFPQPYIEQEWTKGDILKVFGVYDNKDVCESPQYFSGFFCLRKCAVTVQLVNDWVKYSLPKLELVTDKKSKHPNKDGFVENRHDQSLFSVLVKKYPHIDIPYEEVLHDHNPNPEENIYPIQVVRHKEKDRPFKIVLINKLLLPWRAILHVYFKYFKKYEYLGFYSW